MRRLLLFDVDGTLLTTAGAGRAAIASAMRAVYGETGPVEDFDFHGRTDPGIVRGLLRSAGWEDGAIDERMDDLWPRYLRELEGELATRDGRVRPCPGVEDLLERLRGDVRFELALVTGNVADGAWRKLGAAGLDGFFDVGAFGSDSELREDLPSLAMARATRQTGLRFEREGVWVIGDTPEDVRCARAARVRVVTVATGRHRPDQLEAHGPDHVFPDLRETATVMRALEG